MTLKTQSVFGTSGAYQLISGAGVLYQLRIDGQIARGCLWVCDSSSSEPVATPSGGQTVATGCIASKPIECGVVELDFGAQGLPFSNGLYVCVTPTETFVQGAVETPRAVHAIYTQ